MEVDLIPPPIPPRTLKLLAQGFEQDVDSSGPNYRIMEIAEICQFLFSEFDLLLMRGGYFVDWGKEGPAMADLEQAYFGEF